MSVQLHHLLDGLDQIAPFSLAENWDNVGLLVGNPDAHITSILLGLDPGLRLLDEAIARGANTIITHHPCIFHPLSSVITKTPAGAFFEKALSHKINIIACHTNLDNSTGGVSDALAWALGLSNLSPLRPGSIEDTGAGRIGVFSPPLPATAFMDKLFQTLQLETIQIAGRLPEQIRTVALCGGSGSDLAETALQRGADLYLSAEIKHSTARWAEECGFCIIDGTHYGTEQPVIPFLQRKIQALAATNNWPLEVFLSQTERHPFIYKHRHNSI
ncbi:MAG: Nif3-like dinuclear metal center hexameric protein [Proteobacteria bacterium]|nr:Nif3-like dinuclear metal center hexameric protein [Pseudomonadota bacterium]MBU1649706.1 Nif3-like dinuclear metal center hexameric protein [Pseudomonadota bacterium]MBU1986356.1 Nif3-like dinuclear metal center hexameric protein [Pseudomonadota bacterium]